MALRPESYEDASTCRCWWWWYCGTKDEMSRYSIKVTMKNQNEAIPKSIQTALKDGREFTIQFISDILVAWQHGQQLFQC